LTQQKHNILYQDAVLNTNVTRAILEYNTRPITVFLQRLDGQSKDSV